MNTKEMQKKMRRATALAVLAVSAIAATSAHATTFVGGVDIKGKYYLDGVEQPVRCSAGEGNAVDGDTTGVRYFALMQGPKCAIYWDTSNVGDFFKFVGQEDSPTVNGGGTSGYVFSGIQTAPSPAGTQAVGAVSSVTKCSAGGCKESGKITYSRTNYLNQDVVFIGTWKARYN